MNSRNPGQPEPGSTEATRAKKLATPPLVMKHFSPLMRYDPPLSTAWVRIPARSLPASGSVAAKHPMRSSRRGKSRSCCSGVPRNRNGIAGPKFSNICAAAALTRAMFSARITHSVDPASAPPYFSGVMSDSHPSSR